MRKGLAEKNAHSGGPSPQIPSRPILEVPEAVYRFERASSPMHAEDHANENH
jgi:hypothetical protein